MTIRLAAAVLAAVCFVGCGNTKEQRGLFDYSKPVDMTSVLQAYEWHLQHADEDSALTGKLMPDLPDYDFVLFADTSFALRIPEYSGSDQPFLKRAEDFYNSCMLSWNVYSNYEVYLRSFSGNELAEEDEVRHGIQSISTEIINDGELRSEAEAFKDSILALMDMPSDMLSGDDRPSAITYVMSFNSAIERKSYCYYDDEEAFVESLDSMSGILRELSEDRFQKYLDADKDHQLKVILDELAACASFDEQCSLWHCWADCGKSDVEDEWIVAVAALLMKSGSYCPILNDIWITWRAFCQAMYFGASRDSSIPNDYYNSYRQLCYKACLPRIEGHPGDAFAMNCAASIGGRTNMNRFGRNYFGNEAMIELFIMLPNRYNMGGEGNEEEEDEEEDV